MNKDFSVYDMKRVMRGSNNNKNTKQQKIFEKLIDETLKFNRIVFTRRSEFLVHIPDFMYEPKLDMAYFIDGKKINIEVDGGYHDTRKQTLSDEYRDAKLTNDLNWIVHRLKEYRYEVLWNREITIDFKILEEVYVKLYDEIKELFGLRMRLPQSLIVGILHSIR